MNPKKPLREAMKDLLEQESLTEQELVQLQQATKEPKHHQQWFRQYRGMLAGMSVAAVLVIFLLVAGAPGADNNEDIQQRIAQEVLTNHLKIKALDIETESMDELRQFFERLDFSPYFSARINGINFRLLGGRYCTLQGVIASQLRLLLPDGEVVTYYQALYDKKYFGKLPDITQGDKPHIIQERGFEMTIWKEQDVVTVLAQAIN